MILSRGSWLGRLSVSLLLAVCSLSAQADDWQQFERTQQAVRKFNFDVSFVQVRPNQLITYRWLHGLHEQSGALSVPLELERLLLQDGVGTDTFRRGDKVYYAAPDAPVIVTQNDSIKELPAILFEPLAVIKQLYDIVPGSSVPLSGRTAQLLRLSARDASRYSYWLWQDAETGFPLRVDTVDEQNEVLDRWMVVHLQLKTSLPPELQSLISAQLPEQPHALVSRPAPQDQFKLNWIPPGYQLLAEQAPVSTRSVPVLANWLLSDGLHQISVFVQPTARLPQQQLRDGAVTILVTTQQNLDVTVIGPLRPELAAKLAASVE